MKRRLRVSLKVWVTYLSGLDGKGAVVVGRSGLLDDLTLSDKNPYKSQIKIGLFLIWLFYIRTNHSTL